MSDSPPAGNSSTHMFLYQRRVLALDSQFVEARKNIDRLLRQIRYNPRSVQRSAARSQLGLIRVQIGLIKEETAFLVKLGQLYDMARFYSDFTDLLMRQDPDLLYKLLKEMEARHINEDDWDDWLKKNA